MKYVLGILYLLGVGTAQATTPEYIEIQPPRLELALGAGLAMQSGYLTTKDSVSSYYVGVNFGLPRSLLSFDWQGFSARHDTGEFALANNQDTNVAIFSFTPYFSIFNRGNVSGFLGVGITHVELSQSNPMYRTTFGAFTYSGLLRYQFDPKWSLQYKMSWLGVEQTVNAQTTSFEIWNHALAVGYSID